MSRILIDGRFIGVGESMTRYGMEIVRGILELDQINDYTLLVRPAGQKLVQQAFGITNDKLQISNENREMSKPEKNNSKLDIRNSKLEVLDIPHYSLGEQTKLLRYLNSEKFDLVHFIQFNHPIRYRGKFVVTIHDLTLLGHLHRESLHKKLAFARVMKSAVKNSAKIITISETSKKEIIEYYGVPEEKIEVTHLGVDGKYNDRIKNKELRIKQFREKHNISGDYLLYTGMWKKHKNIVRMLKAYKELTQKLKPKNQNLSLRGGYEPTKQSFVGFPQLVLVGKPDSNEPEVTTLINEINNSIKYKVSSIKYKKHNTKYLIHDTNGEKCDDLAKLDPIITTGYVEESELPLAYAGALAYIMPSLSEGFGLPPLEAMACGVPVISSNASAMPEILGDAPLYFNPYEIDDMASTMKKIIGDENLRQELIDRGLAQAAKYSWQKTAEKTLQVYREALIS